MNKKAVALGIAVLLALAGCAKNGGPAQNADHVYNMDKVRFESYPADFPIAYLGMIRNGLFTVRDLYGTDAPFAAKFMDTPCVVTVEEAYYDDVDVYGFYATILLTLGNPEGEGTDAMRLTVSFRALYDEGASLIDYVKLTDLRTGGTVERNPPEGDMRALGEVVGIFAGAMDVFWDLNAFSREIPEELQGTWVRTGAASKRAFDSTLIITADQLQWEYSDGRSATSRITGSRAIANDGGVDGSKAMKKAAAEYPTGWNLNRTTTAAEGDVPWKLDSKGNHRFFLNADKNRLTQSVGDPTDIWVKQ